MKLFNVVIDFVAAIVNSYSSKDEIYHHPLPTITERAGFRVNETLAAKVLVEKYKQKYLPK